MQGKLIFHKLPSTPSPAPLRDEADKTLPVLTWRTGFILITPLPRVLEPFLYATRLLTWNADNVRKAFDAQDTGSRHMFALWIPEPDWVMQLDAYERRPEVVAQGGGPGRIYSVWKDAFVDWVDARLEFPTLVVDQGAAVEARWRPVATVAADFDNLEFELEAHFGGDMDKMRQWFACRDTRVASVSMLAVVAPWQGKGVARDAMEFVEEWVLRRGWTCEDAPGAAEICRCATWPVEDAERPRRLPPVMTLALATDANDERTNRMYRTRGYHETQVITQEWGDCKFYIKHW